MFTHKNTPGFTQEILDKMNEEVAKEMEIMKLNDFIDESGETLKWVESKILKKYEELREDEMAQADADYEQDQLQAQAESEAIAQAEYEAEMEAHTDSEEYYDGEGYYDGEY